MCLDLEIRRVQAGMLPALAELFDELAKAREERFFLPHPLTPAQAAQVANYQGPDLYTVALHDDKAIAYGLLRGWDEGYETPSLGISVHPNYRGVGIGLALMHYLHAAAALRGCEMIRLRVHQDNDRARRIYQEMGYRFEESREGFLTGFFHLKDRATAKLSA